jgi:hypothetical protein
MLGHNDDRDDKSVTNFFVKLMKVLVKLIMEDNLFSKIVHLHDRFLKVSQPPPFRNPVGCDP